MNRIILLIALSVFISMPVLAEETRQLDKILITNVKIFDGKSKKLTPRMSVLVEGNKIAKIGSDIKAPDGAEVIDANGRTMTPGFIDAHAHIMFQMSIGEAMNSDEYYWAYVATKSAGLYLNSGFTTIRDASGNSFSLKKAIDRGIIVGPRIYPSGPMISQTSGHSDHRTDAQKSAMVADEPSTFVKYDMVQIADGRAEVLIAVREALRRGASQIKIAVGGGTGSYADPLDVTQYTDDEIRAAVEAAADWGTYVMAHAYNSKGIRRAIKNGVKSIEHGNLIDQPTMKLMKKKGIWLSGCHPRSLFTLITHGAIPRTRKRNMTKPLLVSTACSQSQKKSVSKRSPSGQTLLPILRCSSASTRSLCTVQNGLARLKFYVRLLLVQLNCLPCLVRATPIPVS